MHRPVKYTGSTLPTGWSSRLAVLMLLLLGTALRMSAIGTTPPGLYHDEAQHGIDALAVLEGRPAFYFQANNGREPVYIYLVTAAVGVLGRSPLAIRLPACYVGILTLAASYDLGRTLWGKRAGRWLLAILAVTFWHVHLSRMGFRAVLLPLFTALALSQAAKALRFRRSGHWVAAGVFYGASWYTYMAARFTPIAIAALIIYGLLTHRTRCLSQWRGMVLAAAAALIVLLPLGIYTLVHPDIVLARSGQVSIFNETIHRGRFWATLGSHILKTAGMFTVRGDRIWRHNLAWRPVWDPALGLAFVLGVGVALGSFRRNPGAALGLLWTAAMALPTLLAEDAPHFLRGVGVLPTAVLMPVLGLDWISARLVRARASTPRQAPPPGLRQRWCLPPLSRAVPVLFLTLGLASTVYDYFVRYQAEPLTYHWLEGGPVAMAAEVNELRGAGWNGTQMLRNRSMSEDNREPRAYFDADLYAEWTAVPYLLPEPAVHFLPTETLVGANAGAVFVVWPYRSWEQDVLPALAHPVYIQVRAGPEAQGDLDPEPYVIATIIEVGPRPDVPAPIAAFEEGIVLRAALVEVPPETPRTLTTPTVNLWWETTQSLSTDYTVFVHYLRNGARIAQHDGPPGLGHLNTTTWQPGDLILDRHAISDLTPKPEHDVLRIGLYDPSTGEGLGIVDPMGAVQADAFETPVILIEP